jgi:NAD(P)-dependent dehydrogenase (short-subunit alcohol dehydrogenase family)
MSKKACIAFSDGLRQEMAKFGVRVITVEPGLYKVLGFSSQECERSCICVLGFSSQECERSINREKDKKSWLRCVCGV